MIKDRKKIDDKNKFNQFKQKHLKLESQKQLLDSNSKMFKENNGKTSSELENKTRVIKELELKLKRENLLMKMADFDYRVNNQ